MSIDNCTIARVLPFIGKKHFYYATHYGQILSYESGKWKTIGRKCEHKRSVKYKKRSPDGLNYKTISSRGSVLFNKYVHKLVAMVFCPRTSLFQTQVDHIDGNKFNNRADNLRWCTQSENKHFAADIRKGKTIITNLQKSLFYA